MVATPFPANDYSGIYPMTSKIYLRPEQAFIRFLKKNLCLEVWLLGLLITAMTFWTAPWIIPILARKPLTESTEYHKNFSLCSILACS